MLATMNQIVNLLSGFQKQFPPTNNQLRTSTNPKTQATIQAGQIITESVQRRAPRHVARECKEKKQAKDSQWFKDKALLMEAKEKGAILDAEAEAFLADVECTAPYAEPLAITTTTAFEVSHEDAYDFNVDEAPHAAAAFMANLMQTGPSTGQGTSNDTDFHSEIHVGEQIDSDVDSVIDDYDNTIPYHRYQLNNEVESVPTDVSSVVPGGISVITILDVLRVYDSKETLVQAEVSRTKMLERMKDPLCKVSSKPINYAKLNSMYDTFVPQKQLSREQVYWLPANEVASYNCIEDNIFKEVSEYMKIFDELDKEYDQCVIDKKSLEIKNKNFLIQNECLLAESVSKDICSVVVTSDIAVPMSVDPRSNCVKEHSRNLELEAEILKVKQLLVEKAKRCSFIETNYQELELKFQMYKECFENPQVCNNSSSPELNVFFEINKLKDQLQGKYELIRKLKAQIDNMKEVSADPNLSTLEFKALEIENTQLKEGLTAIRIKNDSLRDANVSIKKRYQDLYKSKGVSNSNVSSGVAIPEKPKVLAPCLYAKTPKYVPLQKRNNREANTPLPRKETIVKNLNFVNAKNPKVNNDAIVKEVWKATSKIFASVGSKWRPTGRKFTLGDTCPLTRITKPKVVPLEKSGSFSISEPANNVIVTPRFSKKPLTSYKCKDRKLKDTSTGSPPNAKTKAVNDPVIVNDLSANQLDPNKN
ncbi:hypothetical protein Tco_0641265 [Tanacetum coccineum]